MLMRMSRVVCVEEKSVLDTNLFRMSVLMIFIIVIIFYYNDF